MKWHLICSTVFLVATIFPAYGAFDSDGNYYCNPNNLALEQTIYKSAVTKLDSDVQSYLSLNPSATDQELHNYIVGSSGTTQPTYYIMEQSKACLRSNGINPNSVMSTNSLLLEVFAAPEFGAFATIAFLSTFVLVLVLQARLNRSVLIKKF